jgi:hypothetical protein
MMFEQMLNTYRSAAESTLQLQQMMLRNWTQQWPQVFSLTGVQNPGTAWMEQAQAMQKKWAETITAMLEKHRETLDHQYKAGIKTIEDSFKLGQAKDPEQFMRLTEELWKHSFEALKTVTEEQMKQFQDAMQKWFELASQGSRSMKV